MAPSRFGPDLYKIYRKTAHTMQGLTSNPLVKECIADVAKGRTLGDLVKDVLVETLRFLLSTMIAPSVEYHDDSVTNASEYDKEFKANLCDVSDEELHDQDFLQPINPIVALPRNSSGTKANIPVRISSSSAINFSSLKIV